MSKTIGTSGSQSLAGFQTVVQQKEGVFGPLIALGKQGSDNTITYDIGDSPAKANRAVLDVYEGAEPPSKDNHTLICTGDCLVEGASAKVAAYRPS